MTITFEKSAGAIISKDERLNYFPLILRKWQGYSLSLFPLIILLEILYSTISEGTGSENVYNQVTMSFLKGIL